MIPAALVLLGLGLADIVRQFAARTGKLWATSLGIIAIVIVSALAFGLGAPALAYLIVPVGLGWMLLMPIADGERAIASFWPVVALAILAVWLVLTDTTQAKGPVGDWWSSASTISDVSLSKVLFLCGMVIFLLESSNIVVRTALQPKTAERVTENLPTPAVQASRRAPITLRRLIGEAIAGPVASDDSGRGDRRTLRGGRLIGPLERVFVVGLLFAGQVALLAAIVAAKGIVRFPEIQNDKGNGTQAEYFLVGSMTSWALALVGTAAIWAVGASPAQLVGG